MLTDKPGFICTGNVLCCQWRFGDVRQRQLLRLMFLITQYNIAVGIGELNGQPFRIDTVQHALDGGRWCQGHGIIEQRVAFADFADRQAVSVQRRDGIQPPLNPPLTTLEFYHRIAGGILHHAQRMIRQEILLETLLLVSIKPGKIRLVIGKNTGHQFDIRAVIVSQALIPRLAKFTVSPAPLFFTWRNMVVGNV